MHNTAQELRTPDYVLARNVPDSTEYIVPNKRYKVCGTVVGLLNIEPDGCLGYTKDKDHGYKDHEYVISSVKGSAHLDGGDWTRGYAYHV